MAHSARFEYSTTVVLRELCLNLAMGFVGPNNTYPWTDVASRPMAINLDFMANQLLLDCQTKSQMPNAMGKWLDLATQMYMSTKCRELTASGADAIRLFHPVINSTTLNAHAYEQWIRSSPLNRVHTCLFLVVATAALRPDVATPEARSGKVPGPLGVVEGSDTWRKLVVAYHGVVHQLSRFAMACGATSGRAMGVATSAEMQYGLCIYPLVSMMAATICADPATTAWLEGFGDETDDMSIFFPHTGLLFWFAHFIGAMESNKKSQRIAGDHPVLTEHVQKTWDAIKPCYVSAGRWCPHAVLRMFMAQDGVSMSSMRMRYVALLRPSSSMHCMVSHFLTGDWLHMMDMYLRRHLDSPLRSSDAGRGARVCGFPVFDAILAAMPTLTDVLAVCMTLLLRFTMKGASKPTERLAVRLLTAGLLPYADMGSILATLIVANGPHVTHVLRDVMDVFTCLHDRAVLMPGWPMAMFDTTTNAHACVGPLARTVAAKSADSLLTFRLMLYPSASDRRTIMKTCGVPTGGVVPDDVPLHGHSSLFWAMASAHMLATSTDGTVRRTRGGLKVSSLLVRYLPSQPDQSIRGHTCVPVNIDSRMHARQFPCGGWALTHIREGNLMVTSPEDDDDIALVASNARHAPLRAVTGVTLDIRHIVRPLRRHRFRTYSSECYAPSMRLFLPSCDVNAEADKTSRRAAATPPKNARRVHFHPFSSVNGSLPAWKSAANEDYYNEAFRSGGRVEGPEVRDVDRASVKAIESTLRRKAEAASRHCTDEGGVVHELTACAAACIHATHFTTKSHRAALVLVDVLMAALWRRWTWESMHITVTTALQAMYFTMVNTPETKQPARQARCYDLLAELFVGVIMSKEMGGTERDLSYLHMVVEMSLLYPALEFDASVHGHTMQVLKMRQKPPLSLIPGSRRVDNMELEQLQLYQESARNFVVVLVPWLKKWRSGSGVVKEGKSRRIGALLLLIVSDCLWFTSVQTNMARAQKRRREAEDGDDGAPSRSSEEDESSDEEDRGDAFPVHARLLQPVRLVRGSGSGAGSTSQQRVAAAASAPPKPKSPEKPRWTFDRKALMKGAKRKGKKKKEKKRAKKRQRKQEVIVVGDTTSDEEDDLAIVTALRAHREARRQ